MKHILMLSQIVIVLLSGVSAFANEFRVSCQASVTRIASKEIKMSNGQIKSIANYVTEESEVIEPQSHISISPDFRDAEVKFDGGYKLKFTVSEDKQHPESPHLILGGHLLRVNDSGVITILTLGGSIDPNYRGGDLDPVLNFINPELYTVSENHHEALLDTVANGHLPSGIVSEVHLGCRGTLLQKSTGSSGINDSPAM